MKPSTMYAAAAKLHQMSGRIKTVIGNAIDSRGLVATGAAEIAAGKRQAKLGELKRAVGN